MPILRFQTNVPQELRLQSLEGRTVESQFGGVQHRFSASEGAFYVSDTVGRILAEQFRPARQDRRGRAGARRFERRVGRCMGPGRGGCGIPGGGGHRRGQGIRSAAGAEVRLRGSAGDRARGRRGSVRRHDRRRSRPRHRRHHDDRWPDHRRQNGIAVSRRDSPRIMRCSLRPTLNFCPMLQGGHASMRW